MARQLTARQREILDYIAGFIEQRGFPPTIREIGNHFGIGSLRGVTIHLDALSKKGWIERGRNPRSIRLTSPRPQLSLWEETRVPLVGTIAAGLPVLAEENIEDYIPVPPEILARAEGSAFALRVRGDSMIDDHIMPGDVVIVSEQQAADSGDIVAALAGEEATVKRLKKEAGRVLLAGANPRHEPVEIGRGDWRILGKVIGLIRRY